MIPSSLYFYPRSPCGERLKALGLPGWLRTISIHALLAESDFKLFAKRFSNSLFLSTLSLRRATIRATILDEVIPYFYPRSPCGERPGPAVGGSARQTISIHALLAESDHSAIYNSHCKALISIHALLAESDVGAVLKLQCIHDFYPRSPCGERLCS